MACELMKTERGAVAFDGSMAQEFRACTGRRPANLHSRGLSSFHDVSSTGLSRVEVLLEGWDHSLGDALTWASLP